MNAVKFSVVVPLYNKIESVERTLESICRQRHLAAEIIVIDDGSTDGSAEKVEQLNLPKVRLVKQPNQGVSVARNLGVALAKFEYVAFIDADDQWSPFFLAEMEKLIRRFPEHQCFASNYQKVFAHGEYLDPKLAIGDVPPSGYVMRDYFDICSKGDLPFMTSSLVITRSLFSRLGGFPIGEVMGEDQALFCQAALQASIVYSPLVLLLYHTDSENRACDRHLPDALLPFAQRLFCWIEKESVEQELKNSILAYCAAQACQLAKRNIQAGNFSVAKGLLQHPSCELKPLQRGIFLLWLLTKSSLPQLTVLKTLNSQTTDTNSK